MGPFVLGNTLAEVILEVRPLAKKNTRMTPLAQETARAEEIEHGPKRENTLCAPRTTIAENFDLTPRKLSLHKGRSHTVTMKT